MQTLKLVHSLILFGYITASDLHQWRPCISNILDGSQDIPVPEEKQNIIDNISGKYNACQFPK